MIVVIAMSVVANNMSAVPIVKGTKCSLIIIECMVVVVVVVLQCFVLLQLLQRGEYLLARVRVGC